MLFRSLSLIKEFRSFKNVKGRLIEIAADGEITCDERADFEVIERELDDLIHAAKQLKHWAQRRKQKPALGRVAEERAIYTAS